MDTRPAGKIWLIVVAVLALLAAACGGGASAEGDGSGSEAAESAELSLVAYSTPQKAYEEIISAFQNTEAGQGVTFSQSYGASGDQSRAVVAGLEADYAAFSLEPDMTRLVDEGLVEDDWNSDEYKGMVTNSVVVLIVRKGNPKDIKDWDDLTKDGVEVITPNPFTSGGARWNVMAAYGAASDAGADEQAGVDYLHALFNNVSVQDESARKSLQTFTSGKGDVLLGYENEAIFAQSEGAQIDYVVPDDTILIENPAAVGADSKNPEQAEAFREFVVSEEAQKIFVDNGYRPVVEGVAEDGTFPDPPGLFTIEDFGGWSDVMDKFFDPEGSIMADVERSIGVSVEG
jgi:sulfate/thiosulfate transport system substrate-binding protein